MSFKNRYTLHDLTNLYIFFKPIYTIERFQYFHYCLLLFFHPVKNGRLKLKFYLKIIRKKNQFIFINIKWILLLTNNYRNL